MLSALSCLAATTLAAAPLCPPGQRPDRATPDKCCFAGQTWSKKELRCTGTPQCPPGLTPVEERCVEAVPSDPSNFTPYPSDPSRAAPPPPLPPPSPPPPAYVPSRPPPQPVQPLGKSTWVGDVLVPPGHHVERQPRSGLWGGGIALFGGGWFLAGLSSLIAYFDYATTRNGCAGFAASTNWIPVAGPIINVAGQAGVGYVSGGFRTSCTTRTPLYEAGVVVAIFQTIAQLGGITMFILGFTVKENVVVRDDPRAPSPAPAPTLSFDLGAPGSPAGFSARLTW